MSAAGTGGAGAGPLARPLGAASRAFAASGSLLILAAMLLVDADVLGRELLARPVRGVSELLALLVVTVLFLQLPETLRSGRLARSEVLLGRLARRAPGLAHGLDAAFHLLGAALLGLLAIAVWPALAEAWREGLYVGAAGDFTAPLWPVRLATLLGALLTAALFLAAALERAGRALGRSG